MTTKPKPKQESAGESPIAGPEWTRLAEALKARRAELDITQRELTDLAKMSFSAYTPIETQRQQYVPSTKTLRRIAVALGWTPTSCELILAGKKPVIATNPQPTASSSEGKVSVDAFSLDLGTIRDRDPEGYAALIAMARRLAQSLR